MPPPYVARWSHARLCTDDAGQDPAQRGLPAELVDPVLALPEDNPSHQELPEDLAALHDLAPEETPPVRESYLHVPLDVLQVPGADGPETFEPGQLGLEGASPLLPRLNAHPGAA